jgi:glycosyltransferase involved in cell wall biosynthesis
VLKILREEKNLDLQLVITGKPDPHYPEVQNAVEKFQLQDQVVFPGLVPEKELIHLYNAAFIFVYPSLYEGFGLPPLESMRCGTPVVASNSSSIPEVCGQENALFFNPHDTQQIADQIEKLFKDANLQVELIAKGSQHAAKFTWQKTGENTWGAILKAAKSA